MDKWFNNSNVIRVVAILIGVLLWVIVRLDVENSGVGTQPATLSQKYTAVSINIRGLDENRFILQKVDPQRVNLQISGTAAALRRVDISDYQVLLDLTAAEPGTQMVQLKATGFPDGVEVVIDPPNVNVTLEEKLRKEIPVTVNVTGTPAEGYHAGEPVVEPNRVNVMVSGSVAEEISAVVGEISVDAATDTVKNQVKLVALNGVGVPVDVAISPPVVDVVVPITSPFKTVPLQIKLVGTPPPGLAVGSFEQSVSEVTVYGQQAYLNSLEFYDGLTIDLMDLTKTTDFEFKIPMKDGVEQINPVSVTARVTIVEAVTTSLSGIELTMNGKSEDYDYQVIAPTESPISVSVEAAPDIVTNLTINDVKAIVNVSNLPPGAHELPVEYNLPSFVKTAPGNVSYVTILIEPKDSEEPVDGVLTEDDKNTNETPPVEKPAQGEGPPAPPQPEPGPAQEEEDTGSEPEVPDEPEAAVDGSTASSTDNGGTSADGKSE